MVQTITVHDKKNGRIPAVGKAAIYCRVSTDRQEREGASLDTQLRDCLRLCETHSWDMVVQYVEAESGLNSDRAEYQRMLHDAQEGQFDILVVWRMDRLGRDTADYFSALKTFRRLGITVHSATEPTDNPFVQGLFGLLGEEESRRLSFRIIPNKQARAREGKWNGVAPFGYDLVNSPDGKGKVLEPNEDAPLIPELFSRYAVGRSSLGDLLDWLAEHEQMYSRQGIRRILRNRVYVGKVVYGNQARSQFAPISEPFESEGLHPALVDVEIFQRVQDRLQANKSRHRGGPHPHFLLTGRLRCGKCGGSMSGRRNALRWTQYICSTRNNTHDCDQKSISGLKLEPQVMAQIKAILKPIQLTDVRDKAKELMAANLANQQQGQQQAHDVLQKRKEQQEERLTALENALLDTLIQPARYTVRRDEILGELQEIAQSLAQITISSQPDYEELFAIVDNITWDDLDDEGWRELLETLVDRVVITDQKVTVAWLPICQSLLAVSNIL